LIESLNKENIPFGQSTKENPLNFWLESFKIREVNNNEAETVYTNWFPFGLPEKVYIHKPIIKNKIDLVDIPYSFIDYNDRHICFFPKEDYPPAIECQLSTELEVSKIIREKAVPIDEFLVFNEPKKKVVELSNKVFKDFLIQKKLGRYEQANQEVFYYPSTTENRRRISLKSLDKTNVAVSGKTKGNTWSHGISLYAVLYPFCHFRISSHIIFAKNDLSVLEQNEQKRLRRSFGFDWYNKDWLDTLLGMMLKVSGINGDKMISISVSHSSVIAINTIPFSIESDFGYFEPEKETLDVD
jgi:hypothetical protein